MMTMTMAKASLRAVQARCGAGWGVWLEGPSWKLGLRKAFRPSSQLPRRPVWRANGGAAAPFGPRSQCIRCCAQV